MSGGANIAIHGSGIAASSCLHLLTRAGQAASWDGIGRSHLPAVMLSGPSQNLLRDIFEQPDLFAGLPQVRRRVVAWGREAPVTLPHSAVVVSEQALLDRIQKDIPSPTPQPSGADWTIYASKPLPKVAGELDFGSRTAAAASVTLIPSAPKDACWTESLEHGWLFLLPGLEKHWLLAVGGSVQDLLAQSRVIAKQIAEVHPGGANFASHPRIADPLCASSPLGASGWFACGTAALAFDPLCGDGVGNAAREAILASAAVRAVLGGADASVILEHYRTRLIAGFERHLKLCHEFYTTGRSGAWWDEQIEACDRGIAWCRSKLQAAGEFSYQLRGFSLEPIGRQAAPNIENK